jgi:WD40 repeat protein
MSATPHRALAARIDRACDQFEVAWRAGRPTPIEDHLAAVPASEQAAFLRELVVAELELRRASGDEPAPHEYTARFPIHATAIHDVFSAAPVATRTGPHPLPSVPGYEILGELGRGGMGVVYRARQVQLNRLCALKMVLGGAYAGPEAIRRFLAEAETIARLEHPNIVQIHHIGEAEGLPYIELEYLPGGSLDRAIAGTPRPARNAAGLVEALARGVAEAHRAGVVHRDLKPANILLAADETPKITDFGLAKALGIDRGWTRTESVLGSPSYMAPEQATGCARAAGPAADIYALGAILYELLTGRPPFRAATALETLEQVKTAEPVRPGRLQPGLPRDLETICLTCLDKSPARRYATAAALAEDLRRFGAGEPVLARPPGLGGHAWRWCVRKPALAGALALASLLAASLSIVSVSSLVHLNRAAEHLRVERNLARRQATRAERAERDATEKLWGAYLAQAQARRGSGRLGRRFEGLEALAHAATLGTFPERRGELRDEAIALLPQVDLRPLREVDIGYHPYEKGMPAFDPAFAHYARLEDDRRLHVRRVRDNADLFALSLPRAHESWCRFSADGKSLVITYDIGLNPYKYQVWNLDLREPVAGLPPLAPSVGLSSAAPLLVVAQADGFVATYRLPGGERVASWNAGGSVRPCQISPDGTWVATVRSGGSEVVVRDARTGDVFKRLQNPATVSELAWRPDGRLLAAACRDRIQVWDTESGALVSVLEGHQGAGIDLIFNRAGHLLASRGWDGFTRIWDPVVGRQLVFLPGFFLGWGADDRTAIVWEGRRATIYEVATGLECRTLPHGPVGNRTPPQPNSLWHAEYSPEGRWLASAGNGGVRVFRSADGQEIVHLAIGFCESALFQPDGSLLTYNNTFGLTRWPVQAGTEGRVQFGPHEVLHPPGASAAINRYLVQSRDGRHVLLTDPAHGQALFLDRTAPSKPRTLGPHPAINAVALSPDGRWAATSTWLGKDVKVWDTATGRLVQSWRCSGAKACFSPDGRWLVTCHGDSYHFYHVGDWQPGRVLEHGQPRNVHPMAFRPDGRVMALVTTAGHERAIQLIDPEDGRKIARLRAPEPSILHWLSFSPDGTRLAAATADLRTQVWDLRLVREGLAEMGLDQGFPSVLSAPR